MGVGLEQFNLSVSKDIVTIIVYVITIMVSVWSFVKWVLPFIKNYFKPGIYYNQTGYHILLNIEQNFGKEAGNVIKAFLKNSKLRSAIEEMRLNIIENATGIGIYLCDSNGNYTYANKTLAKMFLTDQESMLGHGWLTSIIDKKTAFDNWQFAVKNKTPYRDVYSISNLNHTLPAIQIYSEAEPSYDESTGEIIGYVGICKYHITGSIT